MKIPDNVALIIPAYNPDTIVMDLINQMILNGFSTIIVVDDGSSMDSQKIFENIEALPEVIVLRHRLNSGKGAALKTAFKYVLETCPDKIDAVITVDADGQHTMDDIKQVAEAINHCDNCLILGTRDFSNSVPLRSRFGNLLTRRILNLLSGLKLDDTQTGLRCIPRQMLQESLQLPFNHYEFELECLFLAKRMGLRFVQIPIKTVYIDDNKSSHFRPLIDSIRIYFVFLRFVFSSLLSFLIDILCFVLFVWITNDILISTYTARVISGTFNFLFNKHAVFLKNGQSNVKVEALYYLILCVVISTLSAIGVKNISEHSQLNLVFIKIFVDLGLFIISFLIQKYIIFRLRTSVG